MSAETINKTLQLEKNMAQQPDVKYIQADAKSLLMLTNLVHGDGTRAPTIKLGGQSSTFPHQGPSFNFGQVARPMNQLSFSNPNIQPSKAPSGNEGVIMTGTQFVEPGHNIEDNNKRNVRRLQLMAKSATGLPGNVEVSPNFFIRGSSQWQLNGTMCFNFQDTSLFHVMLSLTPGRTRDRAQMTIRLAGCPKTNTGFVDLPNRLTFVLVTMKFFNANEEVVETKSMQIQAPTSKQVTCPWDCFTTTCDSFMSIETILKLCELRPKSEISFFGTFDEFEFVLVEVNVHAKFREDPTPLKTSPCDQITPCLKLNFNVSSSSSQLDSSANGRGQSRKESTSSSVNQFQSKYSEMVTFKVGKDAEHSFFVYKSILTRASYRVIPHFEALVELISNISLCHEDPEVVECSPVFKKMFQIEMQEKTSGEIKLPNRNPEEMEVFLDILYCTMAMGVHKRDNSTDTYDGDAGLLLSVLELAHLYEIQDMVTVLVRCIVALENHYLSLSSAMQIFSYGHQYGIADLRFRAVQWIKVNRDKVFTLEGQKEIESNLSGDKETWAALVAELLAKV